SVPAVNAQEEQMVKRHQALAIFCCSLLSLLSVFGCGGGGGGGSENGGNTLVLQPQTVTLQGRVDDGLAHSPIANATCRFVDLQARAAALTAALAAGDADLTVLAQASTALYNAQLDNGIDVAFSSGSESEGGSGDGGGAGSGEGAGDGGGTGGDAGDGGAFSPL